MTGDVVSHRDAGESTWWAPRARAWWVGVLFMIGSACFALGSIPGYLNAVGSGADSVTYFVGSIFFTSAAFLQMREGWNVSSVDRWAGGVQFVGTLFFNFSTGHALVTNLTAAEADRTVWRPDALGSICFLVASELALYALGRGWVPWFPRVRSWWIAAINMAGSIAFGISAVASYVIVSSDVLRDAERANLGTFIGAVCFLVGALLLLPERTRPSPALE
jgi:hypothetical protein